jgi:hypothetical protein
MCWENVRNIVLESIEGMIQAGRGQLRTRKAWAQGKDAEAILRRSASLLTSQHAPKFDFH